MEWNGVAATRIRRWAAKAKAGAEAKASYINFNAFV